MKLQITRLMKKLLNLSLTLVVLAAFAEISTAQRCIPPPPGMVAWWGLDELNEDGEYVDLAGGDNNGVPFNNPAQIPNEYVGNSVKMGDSNRYVQVPADKTAGLDFGVGNFTIDAWIKVRPNLFFGIESIVYKQGGLGSGGYFLWLAREGGSTQYRLKFQFGLGTQVYDGPIIDNSSEKWIFVAAVVNRNTNTVRLFVGDPTGSSVLQEQTNPNLITGSPNASSPGSRLLIGHHLAAPTASLGIDEVEIFNRALSPTVLTGIFQAQTAGKCKTVNPPCVQPPNTTMVAWYPFDEILGPNAANLATRNTGTHINNPTPILGMVAGALNFDGINDYVQSPSSIVTNFGPANPPLVCSNAQQGLYSSCPGDFSIDAWIRLQPNAPTSVMVIVDKRQSTTFTLIGYSFFLSFNRLGLQLADGGATNYLSTPIATLTNGNWHHVAVTVDRRNGATGVGTLRWYFNGVNFDTTSPGGLGNPFNRLGSLANNSPLRIGTRTTANPLTGWFQGDIDELEIFNRVLTNAEVYGIYQAQGSGKCKTLPLLDGPEVPDDPVDTE